MTVDKTDGAVEHAQNVIGWVRNEVNYPIHDPIIGGDRTLPHNKITNTFIKHLMSSGQFDYVYVAENKIPPIDFPFGETNDFPGLAPLRKGNKTNNPRIQLPFENLYKFQTVDLYFRLGVESLLEVTHTCTEQPEGRCNVCWQCSERRWAFSQLNKIDPGSA